MDLAATITKISENLRINKYRNESDVREAIVNRVLMELGWDIFSPDSVRREFGTQERRRVDYALFTSPNAPSVFIEVKAPNCAAEGDRQLFQYAFDEGAPLAILVDGREWSFYLPGAQGTVLERRVHKLDLLERDAKDAAEVLRRYLEHDRIKTGSAFEDARKDYESAARNRQARDAIPKAWKELASEPDDLLIDLIAEKVVSLIGFRPSDEHVEEFLVQLKGSGADGVSPVPDRTLTPPPKKPESTPSLTTRGSRRVPVVLYGARSEHPDAISALIFLLKSFEHRKPGFLENFAKRAPGRRRNHISNPSYSPGGLI